jgi:hypothetical protein
VFVELSDASDDIDVNMASPSLRIRKGQPDLRHRLFHLVFVWGELYSLVLQMEIEHLGLFSHVGQSFARVLRMEEREGKDGRVSFFVRLDAGGFIFY